MRIYDVIIPNQWNDFWVFIGLGFVSLAISAYLAKVRFGSFPANPIYWHYWVIANAMKPPLVNSELPRIYRPYMFFWAGSLCLFIVSFLVLVVIFVENA
jgi:hypothetical protein